MPKRSWLRNLWVWVLLIAGFSTTLGVTRGEFAAVTQWAHTLCYSCIGLGR